MDGLEGPTEADPLEGSGDSGGGAENQVEERTVDADDAVDSTGQPLQTGSAGADEGVDIGPDSLEPATNLLPAFGANTELGELVAPSTPLMAGEDELAELARSVQNEEPVHDVDSTAMAADLVAEAVATFQEQQGEEDRYDADGSNDFTGTALFPPLAKCLVDGGECRRGHGGGPR